MPADPPDAARGGTHPQRSDRVGTPRSSGAIPPWRTVGLVAAGGALGALARVTLSTAFPTAAATVPWSTLLENLSGAFLLSWLLTFLVERSPGNTWAGPLLGTGALGGYTTFATVGLELHLLAGDGRVSVAALYLAATVAGGLAAGGAGIAAGRATRWRRP